MNHDGPNSAQNTPPIEKNSALRIGDDLHKRLARFRSDADLKQASDEGESGYTKNTLGSQTMYNMPASAAPALLESLRPARLR